MAQNSHAATPGSDASQLLNLFPPEITITVGNADLSVPTRLLVRGSQYWRARLLALVFRTPSGTPYAPIVLDEDGHFEADGLTVAPRDFAVYVGFLRAEEQGPGDVAHGVTQRGRSLAPEGQPWPSVQAVHNAVRLATRFGRRDLAKRVQQDLAAAVETHDAASVRRRSEDRGRPRPRYAQQLADMQGRARTHAEQAAAARRRRREEAAVGQRRQAEAGAGGMDTAGDDDGNGLMFPMDEDVAVSCAAATGATTMSIAAWAPVPRPTVSRDTLSPLYPAGSPESPESPVLPTMLSPLPPSFFQELPPLPRPALDRLLPRAPRLSRLASPSQQSLPPFRSLFSAWARPVPADLHAAEHDTTARFRPWRRRDYLPSSSTMAAPAAAMAECCPASGQCPRERQQRATQQGAGERSDSGCGDGSMGGGEDSDRSKSDGGDISEAE